MTGGGEQLLLFGPRMREPVTFAGVNSQSLKRVITGQRHDGASGPSTTFRQINQRGGFT